MVWPLSDMAGGAQRCFRAGGAQGEDRDRFSARCAQQCCRLVTWHRRAPVVFPAAPAVFQNLRCLTYPFCLAYARSAAPTHSPRRRSRD
eukprot:1175843-Prorocentrum_minimum.AAC.1